MDPLIGPLLLQLLLILVNAFFAASEIAIISLNDNRLRRDAESGDKKAKLMLSIAQHPTNFLSTIQIGITLAGFLASAFAAENFAGELTEAIMASGNIALPAATVNTVMVIAITIVLSFFTLVFGELVPKRIAMQRAEKVARGTIGVVNLFSKLFKPVNWLLSKCTNGVLRLLRIDPDAQDDEISEEEILYMVDVGEEKGAIEASEKEMIANIFEFNNMNAEDVMVHRTDIEFVREDDTPEEILELIRESGYSRFPVCGEDADDIKGILLTRDYLINAQEDEPKPWMDLVYPAYFVPGSVKTDVLFRNMQSSKMHMAIVIDEYGGTDGLVTLEDLLEEIVGNIYDESDAQEQHEIIELPDGTWRIAGSALLTDISDALGIELPESEEFDTFNGLIVDTLSAIPSDGAMPELEAYGLEIKVEEVLDRRIEWASVKKLRTPEPEGGGETENGE